MAKIVFIGAGSWGFTRTIFTDLMQYQCLDGATIGLVDIHAGRLEMAEKACRQIARVGGYNVTFEVSTDRREVLQDADAVLVTVLQGETSIWQHDILVPKKYGVDINVGDTRGVAGIFRGLRTIPLMLEICRDMEELCPGAIMLNYTNPMAILCHAMQRQSSIKVTGLCHSVQGTAEMLANWAGVPADQVTYTCAGLNHLSWFTRFEHNGQDLYPQLRRLIQDDPQIYNQEPVRNEMFKALGYFVTESSGHNSEYSWWFRKRPDLIEQYCTHGTNWNPGLHAYILGCYRDRETTWEQKYQTWLSNPDWEDADKSRELLKPSHEYASAIINAYLGGQPFTFNGNVPNQGLIPNLPAGCCVEVPVLTSRQSLQSIHVGDLPMSVVPLTCLTATIEQLVVEASFQGDPAMVYQAVAQSPLTAAVLSLAEIRDMVNELFVINQPYLPQFHSHRV